MGRVNRLMERRVLRRAADEALLTPAFVRAIDTPPASAPRVDTAQNVDDADPWGSEPDTDAREPVDAITEPIAVTALHDRLRNAPNDFGLDDVPATAHAADRPASAAIGIWKPALIEQRRVRVGPPWYLTKPAAAVAAIAAAAIVVSGVLLVSRGSEQATTVAPEVSTTAAPRASSGQPAPSSAPPAASPAPAAPPPPPPPPSTTPASPAPVGAQRRFVDPQPPVADEEARDWRHSRPVFQRDPAATAGAGNELRYPWRCTPAALGPVVTRCCRSADGKRRLRVVPQRITRHSHLEARCGSGHRSTVTRSLSQYDGWPWSARLSLPCMGTSPRRRSQPTVPTAPKARNSRVPVRIQQPIGHIHRCDRLRARGRKNAQRIQAASCEESVRSQSARSSGFGLGLRLRKHPNSKARCSPSGIWTLARPTRGAAVKIGSTPRTWQRWRPVQTWLLTTDSNEWRHNWRNDVAGVSPLARPSDRRFE